MERKEVEKIYGITLGGIEISVCRDVVEAEIVLMAPGMGKNSRKEVLSFGTVSAKSVKEINSQAEAVEILLFVEGQGVGGFLQRRAVTAV